MLLVALPVVSVDRMVVVLLVARRRRRVMGEVCGGTYELHGRGSDKKSSECMSDNHPSVCRQPH